VTRLVRRFLRRVRTNSWSRHMESLREIHLRPSAIRLPSISVDGGSRRVGMMARRSPSGLSIATISQHGDRIWLRISRFPSDSVSTRDPAASGTTKPLRASQRDSLADACATHLLERGGDIWHIQQFLGQMEPDGREGPAVRS